MSLTPGTKLGPYEILSLIGKGGMGEVYRARDAKLKRDVALKVLPEAFARDPERLARFQREAEVLASLNHPNIAAIYGIEQDTLVMELVEGESPKGPLPFDEAWHVASQIAAALEYAHDKGIIHRDLKPANVKITPDGAVKLLDFGLAKAFTNQRDAPAAAGENSPTLTIGATEVGVVLGTAAYMAPEQAKGKSVDKRADIWAFGVVFYELLAGERPFKGDDVSETLVSVLRDEPDLSRVPPKARKLLRRCLEKDPKKRLRDIGEVHYLLDGPSAETAPSRSQFGWMAWGAVGLLLVALSGLAFMHFREAPPDRWSYRFQIAPPPNTRFTTFRLSPDGRYVAFIATGQRTGGVGAGGLWIRGLDSLESHQVAGTELATYPFWSPDSDFVGFFEGGKLKKVAVMFGPAQTICDVVGARGGTWNRDGIILFADGPTSPIFRVSSAGGKPTPITRLLGSDPNEGHRMPEFLPDGRHFLFLASASERGLQVGSLDGTTPRRLLSDESNGVYLPGRESGAHAGYVLFLREATLMALPFDAAGLKAAEEAFPMAENVAVAANQRYGAFSAARNSTVAYWGGAADNRELVWISRSGKHLGALGKPDIFFGPIAVSPDEKTVAATVGNTGDTAAEIMASAIKEEPKLDRLPASTPAVIRRLIERCLNKDPKRRLQAIGEARIVLSDPMEEPPAESPPAPRRRSWLPWCIAAFLLLALMPANILHFRQTPPAEQPLRASIALPENSIGHSFAISPDGRTLVIAAVVNGKRQLWLRPMDALQAQPMPSTDDAMYPFWSPDSRYIGFFAPGKLKKVPASGGPAQSLCDVPDGRGGSWSRDDVIVFSPNPNGTSIQRVAAAGGLPVDVTRTKGDQRHPIFLPDGRHFLYLARGATAEQNGVYVSSLDGKENRRVLADISGAVFAPPARSERTGHIFFVREATLMAAPFDATSAQLSGNVFAVAEGVSLTSNTTYVPATVSDNGVLLYQAGGVSGGAIQIGFYDRTEKSLGPVGAPGAVSAPAISPDEKSVVLRRLTINGSDLWVRDLSRGTETTFTSDPSSKVAPSWSPKGDRIVFASNRKGGVYNLYQKAASGSGQEELLLPNSLSDLPTQWSRDGRFIVYTEADYPKNKRDLWALPTKGAAADRKPIPFLRTEFDEVQGQLSPDSNWMAYTSDQSGRRQVYVRPFPPGEGEWTISIAGGEQARWRGDGKELFFEAADGKMMAVPVKAVNGVKPSFEAGAPVALFDAHISRGGASYSAFNAFEYDVTADGKRFLITTAGGSGAVSLPPLTVVTNWNTGAKK